MKGESKIKWDLRQMSGSRASSARNALKVLRGSSRFGWRLKSAGESEMEIVGCWWYGYGQTRRKRESRSASGSVCLSVCRARRPPSADPWNDEKCREQESGGSLQNSSGTPPQCHCYFYYIINKVRSKQDLLLKYNLLNCSNLDFGNPAEVGLVPQMKLLFFTLLPNLQYLLNIQTLWNF